MENPGIFIHVGLPKTASTYLQKAVFPHLKNITYIGRPYTQENFAFNSLQYAENGIYDDSQVKQEIDKIINKVDTKNSILISDELFSGYPFYNFINRGMIAERLKKLFPDAEIILFLRGQCDLILSLYNQLVKNGWFYNDLNKTFFYSPGKGFSIEDWVNGNKNWNINNRYINHQSKFSTEHFRYSKLYELYNNLFNNVNVFLYEDLIKYPDSVLKKLVSLLHSEVPQKFEYNQHDKINKSIDNPNLKTKLIQNKLIHLSPFFKRNSGYLISKFISRFITNKENKNREYAMSLIKEAEIFEDNRILDKKINAGMEKYPKQYFGTIN